MASSQKIQGAERIEHGYGTVIGAARPEIRGYGQSDTMHILMIDDDSHVRRLLSRSLAQYNHVVVDAHNGQEGWNLFIKQPEMFEVIITDIEMPELNGIELLQRLRMKGYTIPVIVMTGHEDIEYSIRMLRLGAFDFLLKPFHLRDLLDSLEKLEALKVSKKKAFQEIECFSEHIHIAIPSKIHLVPSAVSLLQDRINVFCELHKIDVRHIGVCLHEALANAVIHGNLEIASALKNDSPERFDELVVEREQEPEFGMRRVTIKCQLTAHMLKFEVNDEGTGFDPEYVTQTDPGSLSQSGRGILIMRAFMDDVFWNAKGNSVTLVKMLQPYDV